MATTNDGHNMRVKISTNPPLPPVKAWFPLALPSVGSTPTVSSLKSLLCTSLPPFRGVAPSTLRLSIDGFELLDSSDLAVVRDGDLVCLDVLDVPSQDTTAQASHATQDGQEPAASCKRKRRISTPSLSSSGSVSESISLSKSESESTSDSDDSSHSAAPSLRERYQIRTRSGRAHGMLSEPEPESASDSDHSSQEHYPIRTRSGRTLPVRPMLRTAYRSSLVPPGYGKPQTRSRNLRRRLKRVHEREAASMAEGGPVSGVNAVVAGKDTQVRAIAPAVPNASRDARATPALLSLSLRNKNKAKNFKSLIGRPLAPKIVFGDQEGDMAVVSTPALPRLIPPSSRASVPPNLFVTSVDVEAGMQRPRKKSKMRGEYGDGLEGQAEVAAAEGDEVDKVAGSEADVDRLEEIADKHWAALAKPTNEKEVTCGMIVGYKALGINPATCTPEQRLTVARVVSCDGGVVVRPLRAPVAFGGRADPGEEGYAWDDVIHGDWRLFPI